MEEILSKLLVADNASILQGTEELKVALKSPDAIPTLCNVIGTSENSQIRQSAAVLLRKKIIRSKQWTKLSVEGRDRIKTGILQAFVREPDKMVMNGIAQIITVIVKHEFPTNGWPEVLQFIQTLNSSESITDKEMGMYLMSVLTEVSTEHFTQHSDYIASLFINTLESVNCPSFTLQHYSLLTMLHFVPFAHQDQNMVNTYHKLMPRAMDIVKAMAAVNEAKACEAMELFDDLLEISISILVPHLKTLMTLCLELAAATTIGDELKVKAIHIIGLVVKYKKKAILKNNFLEPILNILFGLMSLPPLNEMHEEFFTDEFDNLTPATIATQTLDILALHLPPDKLVPNMLPYIEPGLRGTDPFAKKAAYLAMAVIAEGCTEYIRNKYLETFVQCICQGIQESNPVVRNAALFALGQFAEHLQPDVSVYSSQVLPVLFDYLSHLTLELRRNVGTQTPGADRVFYALEMFCENLDDKLLPYLPMLFDRLIATLDPSHPVHIRELAISSIGATAIAANKNLIPYFPRIIESLNCYLTMDETDDETRCLKTQSLDTLGHCTLAVGLETFQPLANDTVQLAMKLLKESTEPDIRKATYGLVSAIAAVTPGVVEPQLELVVATMLRSVRSEEGSASRNNDDLTAATSLYGDDDDEQEEEDIEDTSNEEDDSISGYMISNPYTDEKEEACIALREIAKSVGPAFLPHLERCFEEVFELLSYPHDDVRISAVYALVQFCSNFAGIDSDQGRVALSKALELLVPKLALLVRTDDERSVVSASLDCFSDLLKEVKQAVITAPGHKEAILNCIKDIIDHKTQCQDTEDADDGDDPEAEQDEILIESAGNIVPVIGNVMPRHEFVQLFTWLLPILIKKTKKSCTLAQRSFSVGIISECMEPLGTDLSQFLSVLYPLYMQMARDEHAEVRHNAIFGLGEMALHTKDVLFPKYQEILQVMSASVSKETLPGTLDNICGVLSKLIITNVEAIPMEQVFPVFISRLPLKEDFAENKAVFQCVSHLYSLGHPLLMQYLAPIIRVALVVYHEKQGEQDVLDLVGSFLRTSQKDFPNEFTSAVSDVSTEVLATLQALFTG